MITPHPYQQECIDAVIKDFAEFKKLLLVVPTGGGKSFIFSKVAHHFVEKGERTLILANREELIDQAIEEFYEATGIRPEREQSNSRASQNSPAVVGSIQTLQGSRLERWSNDHFGLVVFDEAHFSINKESQNVLQYFDGKVLGVTATPNRSDKRNLGEYYEKISKEIIIWDLIRDGYLCPIKFQTVPIKIDLSNVKQGKNAYGADFNEHDLSDAMEPYFREIALAIKERAAWRRTLVFLPLIETSKKFAAICNEIGLSARHIDGGSPDRTELKQDFKAGKFEVLCNAMLLSYGYNDRGIDCIVNLRLTQSISLYWQIMGRGTRSWPGKENLLMLECLWQHAKHGLIRPAHLVAKSEAEAQEMMEIAENGGQKTFDLHELQTEAGISREEKLRRELEKNSKRNGYSIDAAEFCLNSKNFNDAEYEPVMGYEAAPVSTGQLQVLSKYSINPASITCRGHADRIIGLIQERVMQKKCSPAQLRTLIKMGHPDPHNASPGAAGLYISKPEYRNKIRMEHEQRKAA